MCVCVRGVLVKIFFNESPALKLRQIARVRASLRRVKVAATRNIHTHKI